MKNQLREGDEKNEWAVVRVYAYVKISIALKMNATANMRYILLVGFYSVHFVARALFKDLINGM